MTLTLLGRDTRHESYLEDSCDKQPYLFLAGQEASTSKSNKFKLTLAPSSLSSPLVSRRDDQMETENEDFKECHSKATKTPQRKRDLKNPMEGLMYDQVSLMREQVNHLSGIHECLKRLNEIEEEKLEIKRRKYKNYNSE